MKSILIELVEFLKEMKFGTECGSDMYQSKCVGCKDYARCLATVKHRNKCDDLLKKLESMDEIMFQLKEDSKEDNK